MAAVYLAHDVRHSRPVAVKVLRPELGMALGPGRFLREIEIAASLNHPHILPLLDSGMEPASPETGGLLWYAMPYVEGESLRTRLERERQLPLAHALRIARGAAAALAYAHERGIVHRDLKPENILLADGEALVADFGIARAITAAGGEKLTPTGLAVGTPAYMSPEQAAGERSIDQRSDIYSLGCVLYEMLAGEPPFTGPTAQAIQAKRLSAPLPSLQLVRAAVPSAVQAAIECALARVPADRFASATELIAALADAPGTGRGPPARARGSRRTALAVALALLGPALGVLLVSSRTEAPPMQDPNLLAVAPFDALAPELQPWSEGIVDVLSRSLDGAGPLRTVPPSVSLQDWSGRADRASTTALGQRTGAGLVLFGSLERRGAGSLGIRASLLEVGSGQTPLQFEVLGDTLRIDGLVDSLAVALLRELGRTRPVGAVRRSPMGARSLPALKAFLRGEQFYRRNLWDSALVHYDRALGLDGSFALARRRLRMVLEWYSSASESFRRPGVAVLGGDTTAWSLGLAPRDSLLVAADGLIQAVLHDLRGAPPAADHFVSRRRLLETLAEARRAYPGDPEVWYTLGEFWTHAEDPSLATQEEILEAFDRAIGLDSAFAPAYLHAPGVALAADLGDPRRARRYLAAYLRLNPADDRTVSLRLTAELLDPSSAALSETRPAVDTAPPGLLWTLAVELGNWPDSGETAVEVARKLAFGDPSFAGLPPTHFLRDPHYRRRELAFQLTRRGHLAEAYRLYPVFGLTWRDQFRSPFYQLALLGAVPAETAAVVFRRALERDPRGSATGLVPALPWWHARGDTLALARFASSLDSLSGADRGNPAVNALRHYAMGAARAYLLLGRADTAAGLRAFAGLPDSVCGHLLVNCRAQKVTEARLLAAAGEDRRAAELLKRWGELDPLAVLERGRIAERLGDHAEAERAYRFVAAVWLHADRGLQRYVDEARAGLSRLGAEG